MDLVTYLYSIRGSISAISHIDVDVYYKLSELSNLVARRRTRSWRWNLCCIQNRKLNQNCLTQKKRHLIQTWMLQGCHDVSGTGVRGVQTRQLKFCGLERNNFIVVKINNKHKLMSYILTKFPIFLSDFFK